MYILAKAMMDVIKDFNAENRGLLSVTIVVKKDDPIYNSANSGIYSVTVYRVGLTRVYITFV